MDFWNSESLIGASKSLETLSLLNVTQPYGLLVNAYLKYDPDRFVRIAGYLEAISVRYNFFGSKPANTQETLYNKISRNISDGTISNLQGIKEALKPIY